jgi:hypothetical protein
VAVGGAEVEVGASVVGGSVAVAGAIVAVAVPVMGTSGVAVGVTAPSHALINSETRKVTVTRTVTEFVFICKSPNITI